MKLLRNPIVVGLLALVALAMVVNSLLPVFRGRRGAAPAAKPPAPAATTPAAPKAAATTPPSTPPRPATSPAPETPARPALGSDIDVDLVQAQAPGWIASPRRDPFQVRYIQGTTNQFGPPARDLLTLNAIWRQTGSTLAVVNNKVVREGDTILDYTVERIDMDRIWVFGRNGREFIQFKSGAAPRPAPDASAPVKTPEPEGETGR